jgi:hypothetical protein
MPKLILFDIDGTLVLTRRRHPGHEPRGRDPRSPNLLDGIPCAGRTDWIILHDADQGGHELDEDCSRACATPTIATWREIDTLATASRT